MTQFRTAFRRLAQAALLALVVAAPGAVPAQANDVVDTVKDALVKIYAFSSRPDYFRPWTQSSPAPSTGSGCVIEGNRILTNAHVVRRATYVQLRRNGSGKRYRASVEHVIHDADLAILKVEDPSFFDGVEPLTFGELPAAQSDVVVYGFPRGGDALSVTKGVVSRIENQLYSHSGLFLLAGQIDAAVNPGNSGGPVIQDGKIVGVVMQRVARGENLGYMVPVEVIDRVFADLADGNFEGFPVLGIRVQSLENRAARVRFGLEKEGVGALVVNVLETSTSAGLLEPGDVILRADGHEIGDDGKFQFRGDERTAWQSLLQRKQLGESIRLDLWRDRQNISLDVPLRFDAHANERIPGLDYEASPRYFIHGGLVFAPVTENLLRSFGDGWRRKAPQKLLHLLDYDNEPEPELTEWVVLQSVLAAEVNEGYHNVNFALVEKVNDTGIRDLDHLVEIIEANEKPQLVLTTDMGYKIIMDSAAARDTHQAIMKRYGIRQDRAL